MKMHGCKTLFIILAAVLCLFSAGGAIFGKVFPPAGISPGAAGSAGDSGITGPAGDNGTAVNNSTQAGTAKQAESPVTADAIESTEPAGAAEVDGYAGSAGVDGFTGIAGIAGVAGIDGIDGIDGNTGYDENAGSDESAGYSESTGSVGSAGYDASSGSDGNAVPILSCRYYNDRDFQKSVNGTVIPSKNIGNKDGNTGNGSVKGGIVPHHLLAGRMISAFFENLAKEPPGTIILIGPNHKLVGTNEIHTSSADWLTAFGTLEADRELAKALAGRMNASENNSLMEIEHSISSLIPYIKYYMPDTKIVPVLLHGSYTKEQSMELGTLLAEFAADRSDVVILASIDFSHYLDVIKADKMDEMTLAAISSWNLDKLSMMSNDNLDSVPSVITLLTAMDIIGARDIDVTGHGNSSAITGSSFEYTTSYYTMFFRASD